MKGARTAARETKRVEKEIAQAAKRRQQQGNGREAAGHSGHGRGRNGGVGRGGYDESFAAGTGGSGGRGSSWAGMGWLLHVGRVSWRGSSVVVASSYTKD